MLMRALSAGCGACPVRIARQDLLFELLLRRDIRKVSQVLFQHDRTDHLHDVRCLCAGGVLVHWTEQVVVRP